MFFCFIFSLAEETSLYRVHVITGDVIGAGTDADVFITFIGSETESGMYRWIFLNITYQNFRKNFHIFMRISLKKKI